MPLTPPPNYSQSFLCAAIGLSIALSLGLLTRSTLPFAGDGNHSLPHGGVYRDGTKHVLYNHPKKLNSVEAGSAWCRQPWLLCITLVLLITYLSKRGERCQTCGRQH
uniref:Movement protein TGB2 n=1 Tax=Potato rough dwarf virus TaxID=106118 RepID=Q1MVD1_9VIRU|nr:12K protein [Potato rough dwarf virus]